MPVNYEGEQPPATQTNSMTCEHCGDTKVDVVVSEVRSTLVIEIPLGWTAIVVPHDGDPGLLIVYTCPRCNKEVWGDEPG